MATLTAAQKLVQAEDAYHRLMIGGQPSVVVDRNGERVEFTRATAAQLLTYIELLRMQVAGTASSSHGTASSSRGPLGVIF